MTWEVANLWFYLKPGIPALAQTERKVVFGSASKAKNLKWGFLERNIFRQMKQWKQGTDKKNS